MQKQDKNETSKSESKIQQEIVMYYRNAFCLKHHSPRCMIFSIPNEGRGAASIQLMATGLYPGCADLMIVHSYNLLRNTENPFHFFEVKSPENKSGPRKNGQSQKQIDFEDHCISMGIPYHLVTSCDQFKQVIENL